MIDPLQVSSQLEWLTTLAIPPKVEAGLNAKFLRKVRRASKPPSLNDPTEAPRSAGGICLSDEWEGNICS